MRDVVTFLSSVAVSSLLSAALIWIAKSLISERLKSAIKAEYDEKLETHKAKIKFESDTEVEKLKSQLQIAAAERNTRFSQIFEKTIEVIAETNRILFSFIQASSRYTAIINNPNGPEREARRIKVGETYAEFFDYYQPRKFFIPEHTADKIDDLRKKLNELNFNFMWLVEQKNAQYDDKSSIQVWASVDEIMRTEVPELQKLLEQDFRKWFGLIHHEG